MALTTAGKNWYQQKAVVDETVYVALAVDGTELSGHGYSRLAWGTGAKTLDNSTSTVTNSADLTVYTATDGSAQDANQAAFFDAATGGNQLTTWANLATDVDAPTNGQSVVFRTGELSWDI